MEWWNFEGYFKHKENWKSDKIKKKIETKVDLIISKWESYQIRLNFILALAKRKLDQYNITGLQRKYYLLYCVLMHAVCCKYPYLVDRKREHRILRYKFQKWGLKKEILDELDKIVAWNKTIQPPKLPF